MSEEQEIIIQRLRRDINYYNEESKEQEKRIKILKTEIINYEGIYKEMKDRIEDQATLISKLFEERSRMIKILHEKGITKW